MTPITYQTAASSVAPSSAALPSVIFGGVSVTLNVLFWSGMLASDGPTLALAMACITLCSSVAGLACGVVGVIRSSNRTLAYVGSVLSSAGLVSFIGLTIYFFQHLPTC